MDLAADRKKRSDYNDAWFSGLLGDAPNVALVAVGGYGRRELLPGSDLDVLLLHEDRDDIGELANRIWYPVWDSGARLDHSVRTVTEARKVARDDLKAVLGLLTARHVAGDEALTSALRERVLADWRADAPARLAGLREMTGRRGAEQGELAFLLEPDLKEARGGLRDVHAIAALAAAWVAPGPGPKVRAAYEQVLDARHVLHEITGRGQDRLVLEVQDEVAATLGMLDADVLLRDLAGAARVIACACDQALRTGTRAVRPGRRPWSGRRRPDTQRRPLADGVVVHDGEVVLARAADPASDPDLVLRAAAAAAQAGLPLAPRTLDRLAQCPPLPVPWPAGARNALIALLGAGRPAVGVWESLEVAGLITGLIPEWERVRNRPQRNPLHTFTVDRHLVETAAHAAGLAREVARPDLLLLAALLHDIGKGWPGDHGVTGAVVARDFCDLIGLRPSDVALVTQAVRHHLLLPQLATRRDLDDPATVRQVVRLVGTAGRPLLELLHQLAIADAMATGPAAWSDWKATLIADLVRRTEAVLDGAAPPEPAPLRPDQLALAAAGGPAVFVRSMAPGVPPPSGPGRPPASVRPPASGPGSPAGPGLLPGPGSLPGPGLLPGPGSPAGSGPPGRSGMLDPAGPAGGGAAEVTVVAPDRPGLLWQAAGVLAWHRLTVRSATAPPPAPATPGTAVTVFQVVPRFGELPDAALVAADLRRMLAGQLDIGQRLDRRAREQAAPWGAAVPVPPPKVSFITGASAVATVVEVRAHDAPGLLWRVGRALGDCGLNVHAARVETLGAEAVDAFYVTGAGGEPVTDPALRSRIQDAILAALSG